ncbi:MAG: Peptidoglycan-binding LysM [Marmoricola sp.]|nr:Peptidoglycan-binding LysM [Marmoricola sp.]
MSTLSIHTPRISTQTETESDVDARFDALVRTAVPAQRGAERGVQRGVETAPDFETVFDLDYGQPAVITVPSVREPLTARRIRVAAVKPRRAAPRAVRLTRRGRAVAVLFFLGAALALMLPMSGWATATLTGGSPEPVRIVEVAPGETLYGIAADLAEPGQIRAMVHRIQELNSLPGAQITEGQKLAVPRG